MDTISIYTLDIPEDMEEDLRDYFSPAYEVEL